MGHLLLLFSLYYARLQLGYDYSSLGSGLLVGLGTSRWACYCSLVASIYLYSRVVVAIIWSGGAWVGGEADSLSHPPPV